MNKGRNYYQGGGPMPDINSNAVHMGPGAQTPQQLGAVQQIQGLSQQALQGMPSGPVNPQQHHIPHPGARNYGAGGAPNRVHAARHSSNAVMPQRTPTLPVQTNPGIPAQQMIHRFALPYNSGGMVNPSVLSYPTGHSYNPQHTQQGSVPYNYFVMHPYPQQMMYGNYIHQNVGQQMSNVAVRSGNAPPTTTMGHPNQAPAYPVGNESGPPVSESMQHYQHPQRPAAPVERVRTLKKAVIQHPDSKHIFSEEELKDTTNVPAQTPSVPAESSPGASIQKETSLGQQQQQQPTPTPPPPPAPQQQQQLQQQQQPQQQQQQQQHHQQQQLSSQALEFRDKISSVALSEGGTEAQQQQQQPQPQPPSPSPPSVAEVKTDDSATLKSVESAKDINGSVNNVNNTNSVTNAPIVTSVPTEISTCESDTSAPIETVNEIKVESGATLESESELVDQHSEVVTTCKPSSGRTSVEREPLKSSENEIDISASVHATTGSQQNGDVPHGVAVSQVTPTREPEDSLKDSQKADDSLKTKQVNHRPGSREDENHVDTAVEEEKVAEEVVEVVKEVVSPQEAGESSHNSASLPVEVQSVVDSMPNQATSNEEVNKVSKAPVSHKDEVVEEKLSHKSDVMANNIGSAGDVHKPQGKFEYESDFLKSLKNNPACLKKPDHLPQLDIIHDEPIINRPEAVDRYMRHTGGGVGDMFLPHYMSGVPPGGRNQSRNSSQRMTQPGRVMSQDKPRKIISTSLTQDVKLHTVDNAWKPQLGAAKPADDSTEKTDELVKQFRGILNKLTPQKYAKLLEEVKKLAIDTDKKLQMILELIFDKAVDEPAFCLQYANLCKHLATLKVCNTQDGQNKEVKFYPLLLTRCQKEFESKMYEGLDVEIKTKKIDDTIEPDLKKLLFDELDEEKRRARKRSLGNIKLIGELYKLDMLKNNIIIGCIEKLLTDGEEESLECLCTLLRTIGAKLEGSPKYQEQKQIGKDPLAPYFNKLMRIVDDKKISARVRFMIQDILDMRKNDWKARKIQDENKPKTIDQIHADAQKEEEIQKMELQQHQQKQRQQDGGRRQPDTWGTHARRSQQGSGSAQGVTAFKNLKNTNSDQMQFGPGQSFGTWSMGARGGSQKAPAPQQEQFSVANRFSALSNDGDRKRTTMSGRDSSKGQSRMQSMGMQQSENVRTPNPPQDREPFMLRGNQMRPPTAPPFGSDVVVKPRESRNSSMEKSSAPNSRAGSIRKESLRKESDAKPPTLTSDKALGLLKDFLSDRNFEEAAKDVSIYCNSPNIMKFIEVALNHALEDTSQVRTAVGELFSYFILKKVIAVEQFNEGLHSMLSIAEDIVVDVPKFWEYMANIMTPLFVKLGDDSRRSFFISALKPSIESGDAGKLMSLLIQHVSTTNSPSKAAALWNSGKLRWSDFIKPDVNELDFVQQNKLDFLNSTSSESSTILSDCEIKDNKKVEEQQQFFDEVTRRVKNGAPPLELEEFIQQHFQSNVVEPAFASALVKSVVKGCIVEHKADRCTSTYTLDDKKLKTLCPMLAKYCENDENCEVTALFALQELAEELEHPSKLLNQIFSTIHEQNVISQDAFLQWEKNDSLVPGKAMAVMNVKQFLTWLRETEDSDS